MNFHCPCHKVLNKQIKLNENCHFYSIVKYVKDCHCGLVVSASAWDETGCGFDSWHCRIYIPCSLNLRLLGSPRGSLGTDGLTQKLC